MASKSKVNSLNALIRLSYSDKTVADAVLRAISPDNLKTPSDVRVGSSRQDAQVTTTIVVESKIPTFIATIDDLLFCVSVAERTVATMNNLGKPQDFQRKIRHKVNSDV